MVVETEGKNRHLSNPEGGVNAVYHMMAVTEAIRYIQVNEHPILGRGILELIDIISSPHPGTSVILSICRTTLDRRTPVGEDEALILGQAEEAIEKVREKVPDLGAKVFLAERKGQCWTGEAIEAKRYFSAWLIDEKGELVQKALVGLKEAGTNAPVSHFSFCTNGNHFCGEAGIPCIRFGSSLEGLAHIKDEYIEVEQLKKTCRGSCGILSRLAK